MNASRHPAPPKKDVCLTLLERAFLYIHLDPRKDGVEVPASLRRQPQLVLRIGYNLAPPIPDLQIEEEAVACTLSFRGVPFACRLPWTAVFAMVGEDGRGMVWSEDVPPEVSAQLQQPATAPAMAAPKAQEPRARAAQEPKPKKPRASKAKRPRPVEAAAPVPSEIIAPPTELKKPKRELPPYLRVIK